LPLGRQIVVPTRGWSGKGCPLARRQHANINQTNHQGIAYFPRPIRYPAWSVLRVCQHDVFVCLWPKRASASWKTGSTHAAHATSKLSRLPRSSNIHGYAHVYVPAHAADRVMMSHPNSVYISRATLLPLQADVDDNNKAMRGGWSAPPQLRPATRESEV
jgi:hypothetical protein